MTNDARTILDRRHPPTADDLAFREGYRQSLEAAELILAARTQAGLSQRELAERMGTSQSVIARLEDADYKGHSMSMLRRVADALQQRIEIRMVPKGAGGAEQQASA